MMPWRTSMAACAFDATISWAYRRRSKPMEALIRSMTAAGPAANRPPHMRCAPLFPSGRVKSASTLLSAGWRDGGFLMVKRVVPALVGAVLLGAVVVSVHYWDPGTPPQADHADAAASPPTSGTVRNFTPTS